MRDYFGFNPNLPIMTYECHFKAVKSHNVKTIFVTEYTIAK